MRKLNFGVIKSKKKFLHNYELSDRAAEIGDKLLQENGLEVVPFGEDRRSETNRCGRQAKTSLTEGY